MTDFAQGILNLFGRIFLCLIFFMSAIGNKIPKFNNVAEYMESEGVPSPRLMLAGAIAFLLLGSASVMVGFKARIGAALLLTFLLLATYFFHDFWSIDDAQEKETQMIAFMKNLALMGAMLIVMARGAGADGRRLQRQVTANPPSSCRPESRVL